MNFSCSCLSFFIKHTTIVNVKFEQFTIFFNGKEIFMGSNTKNADFFDDNFEVTYEDDFSIDNDCESKSYSKHCRDLSDFEVDDYDTYEEDYNSHDRYNDSDYDDDYYDDDYDDDYDDNDYRSSRSSKKDRSSKKKRRSRQSVTRLAAPIQKGGNTVMKLGRTLTRNLSLILMLSTMIYMGYTFLRGSAPYGDIEEAIATNTYTMKIAAYFSVVALLLLYELISMLWAMTRVRVRDGRSVYKEDVGRGLFSFVFLFLLSYASFIGYRWVPESHEILIGLKGVLDVFGSMHNVLFGLCLAGVISCLFRKYSISM